MTRDLRLAKYSIWASGLEGFSGLAWITEQLALVQEHADPFFHLCPTRGAEQPSESETWFYANCLAYEHEAPTLVLPTGRTLARFRYRYVHSGPSKPTEYSLVHIDDGPTRIEKLVRPPFRPERVARAFLVDQLLVILDEIRQLKHGPGTCVLFRGGLHDDVLDLPYITQYGRVRKELSLYAAALRQADFLAECLWYCRVIESIIRSSGEDKWTTWVTGALGRVSQYDFGHIKIVHEYDPRGTYKDVLAVYRRRALKRLNHLRRLHGDDDKVATYLYKTIRCGIAHGVRRAKRGEIDRNYFETVRDTVLLKMLARLAIDEKSRGTPKVGTDITTSGQIVNCRVVG